MTQIPGSIAFVKGVLLKTSDPTFPTLVAFLDEKRTERLWRAWCPYCRRWHIHGAGGKDEDPLRYLGHRAAHCSEDSPLTDTGYILVFGGHWKSLDAKQRRYGPGRHWEVL